MSELNDEPLVSFNGINGATGEYLTPPTPVEQVAAAARNLSWRREHLDDLRGRVFDTAQAMSVLPQFGDGSDIQRVGWGVIFPASARPEHVDAILAALEPLIHLRKQAAGKRFRIYQGGDGFRWIDGRPETKNDWITRHGASVGPVDPDVIPFHLLIVADPQSIPFQFQYELDVQHSVGRIYFPRLADYACYARSVVDAETGSVRLARRAVFFGTAHAGDGATQASADHLVKPLHEHVSRLSADFSMGWSSELVLPGDADRATLKTLLGGSQTPAFLLTATHGMAWPYQHNRQAGEQGALVCQDWKGPEVEKVKRSHYLAAADLPEGNSLAGSILFTFACFGAGTPYWDDYAIAQNTARTALAARPFLSQLPLRLLANPAGGALAVVGHIERAWTHSFQWGKLQSQIQAYQSMIYHLMDGKPIGVAMDDMNVRYAQIASQLSNNLQELKFDPQAVSPYQVAFEWAAANDARGYAVLGDPAVRAAVGPPETRQDTRPVLLISQAFMGALPVVLDQEALLALSQEEQRLAGQADQELIDAHGAFAVPQAPPADGTADRQPSPGNDLPGSAQAPRQEMRSSSSTSQPRTGGTPYTSVVDGLAFALQQYDTAGAESFNLRDDAREKIKSIVTGLNNALQNLARSMEKLTADAATLTVTTSVSDLSGEAQAGGTDLRYRTNINLLGDMNVLVPRSADASDEALLALHTEMVRLALENRIAFLKTIGDTVVQIFGAPKGDG